MLKTKSIYKSKETEDGKRILVSRLHPRGVKKSQYDAWLKELSPSLDLIHEYKNDKITWKRFFSKYKKELEKNPEAVKTLKVIRKESKTEHITLLCFEPEKIPCHRHILRDILKKPKLLKESFIPKFVDN
jgi:uncharacterized protein YeaO (DUF488 family)